jgi:hypothetical protein
VTVELPYPVDRVLVVVDRETGGVVTDELDEVEGEEDPVVGNVEDAAEGRLEDEEDGGLLPMTVFVEPAAVEVVIVVVELVIWAKIVLGQATSAVTITANENFILDIGFSV